MAVNQYHKIITPFLMGQRRDGLKRVGDLTHETWNVIDLPDYTETVLSTADEKLERMASAELFVYYYYNGNTALFKSKVILKRRISLSKILGGVASVSVI